MTTTNKIILPDGQEIQINDIASRQIILPVGASVRVPQEHEWTIMGMSALPVVGYVPPLGTESRNARAWGDIQIRVNDSPNEQSRTNVLTLMDRYWGRYNLNPALPEVAAKLVHAQQALLASPKIQELSTALDHAFQQLNAYLMAAAPSFGISVTVRDGSRFTIEHVPESEESGVLSGDVTLPDGSRHTVHRSGATLDVELLVMIRRPAR